MGGNGRLEWLEGTLVEGKEDKEAWRLMPFELAVVPLVDGRYERTEVMIALPNRNKGKQGSHAILHMQQEGITIHYLRVLASLLIVGTVDWLV